MARARVDRTGPASRPDGRVPRDKTVAAAGVQVDPATEMLQLPDVTGAIFVDGSGRRARRLRRAAYAVVVVVLALLTAFWLLQGLDVFGVLA